MFTGIITAIGQIESATSLGGDDAGLVLTIQCDPLFLADAALGDSIAVQGACLTVVTINHDRFTVEVSRETLNCTVSLDRPGEVNLEKALRMSDRLGGHWVAGHVDGTGTVLAFTQQGESYHLQVLAPSHLGRYLTYKGSVAINGVSLTVNTVEDREQGCAFSINLIPHTVAMTTLKHLQANTQVNLETDLLARYAQRLIAAS